MILPNNGRIIIIDDNINEAQPLINILSKQRIPFNYYSGTRTGDFPINPNENKFRVLFLDLNIFELNKDPKTVISSIDPILRTLIPDNPNPYLLVIWSKQSDEYRIALEDHFHTVLINKKPAKIIFLQKGNYFDYDVDQGWIPQEGCIAKLETDLNKQLESISLLRNLIQWENIVHEKTAETLSDFFSFHPIDENWDKNSKGIIYRLAKAVIGNDDINMCADNEKLAKAFMSINSFLSDKIETEVDRFQLGEIHDIPKKDDDAPITSLIKSKINSVLHTSKKQFTINSFEQGNIYEIPNVDNMIERIIWEKIFTPQNPEKLAEIRNSNLKLIQLDITPVCDYSQDKKYIRLIYGLIIQPEYIKYFKAQYYYACPLINILNEERVLLIDFRHIITITKAVILQRNIVPMIKLRKELCTDIQSQLANQVNRPGISNV
jgi:hypothetical protein